MQFEDLQVGAGWRDHIESEKHAVLLEELLAESAEIKAECEGMGISYVDVRPGQSRSLDSAYTYLLNRTDSR